MSPLPTWFVAFLVSAGVTVAARSRRWPPARSLAAGILAASLIAAGDAPKVSLAVALGASVPVATSRLPQLSAGQRWVLLEVTAALLTLALGVRAHVSGVVLSDSLLTVAWVVLVMEGFRRLDSDESLPAAVAGSIAVAVLVLGALARQPGLASLSAGMAASCASVLVLARRRPSTALGPGGAALLGLTTAELAIVVSPSVPPPESFAVPAVLLAVPLVAAAVGSVGADPRLGSTTLEPRRSARLTRRALGPVTAVTSVLAVLVGRGAVPAMAAFALAGAVAFVVVASGCVRLHREAPDGARRTKHLLALGLAAVATAAPAVVALATARAPASQGASLARSALEGATTANATSTAASFGEAHQLFRRAASRLALPGASLGLAIPGIAANVEAARTLVSLGEQLSGAGMELARASEGLRLREGGVNPAELRKLQPVLERAAAVAARSQGRFRSLNRQLLAGPLRDAVEQLEQRLERDVRTLRLTAGAARHLPAILGGEELRHYFLAFQSNGELRGTGGFIGTWGEIEARDGRLRLTRYARLVELNRAGVRPRRVTLPEGFQAQWGSFDVQQFWEGVNVSPDFPTAARLITELYPQSGGRPVDGVVAIDAPGLAALLDVTGPISVPGWPEPISSGNVVDITLRTAAERFADDTRRHEFLAEVVRHTVDAFTTAADGASAEAVVQALASAAAGNHLLVYLTRPGEQALAHAAGVDGAVPLAGGDSVLVVNQNVGGNKTDLFLRRRIVYRATLRPDGDHVDVRGGLEVSLRNDAPASGLPVGLIGPYGSEFAPGENRTMVALYTSAEPTAADHESGAGVRRERDLGRWVHSSTIGIPSGQSRTVRLALAGRVPVGDDGWYRLDVLHQTSMNPDEAEVVLDVPPPWRIEAAEGVSAWDAHRAVLRRDLDQGTTIALRLGREDASAWTRLWDPSRGPHPRPEGSWPRAWAYAAVASGGLALWRRRQMGTQVAGAG